MCRLGRVADRTRTACHLLPLEGGFTSPPQTSVVSGTQWDRRHLPNCAKLLLCLPRQINENATRHHKEVAKRFEKGKAAATFFKKEFEASGGRSKEENILEMKGGRETGGNGKTDRGDGDGG